MNENGKFALVPRMSVGLEKAELGRKRVLTGMVTDALALAKSNAKGSKEASRPVSILFSADHIITNLKAKERFEVIREIVAHLIRIGQIRPQDEEAVVEAIIWREKRMSTGFGLGCAFPRGRVNCVQDIILAVGVSSSGVEFDALDNQPVNIFALFIAPANSASHEAELQRFGAEIARSIHKSAVREQLVRSNSGEEIWSILKPVHDAWTFEQHRVAFDRH